MLKKAIAVSTLSIVFTLGGIGCATAGGPTGHAETMPLPTKYTPHNCGPFANNSPRTQCCYANKEYSVGATVQRGALVCEAGAFGSMGYKDKVAHWESVKSQTSSKQ